MTNDDNFSIRGVRLVCKHCGGHRFQQRTASLDALDTAADVYACSECGFLHWFLAPEIRLAPDPDESAPISADPPSDDDT